MRFVRSVLCVLLVLTLSVGFAVAEAEDKYVVDGEETVLIDNGDFRLYLTGEYSSIDGVNGVSGDFMSHLSCVVENNGDEEIGSISYSGVINGWSLGSNYTMSNVNGVRPGTKAKTDIWFTTEDTEVTSYEDLETMELTFEVKDEDYDTMFEVSTGVVHFHATPEDAAAAVEETAVEAEEETVVEPEEETAVEPEEAASDETPAAEQQASEPIILYSDDYETLEVGSRGDAVRDLQQALVDQGFLSGGVDGIFGNGTAGGVEAFQESAGLEPTGIADAETQSKLFGGIDVRAALMAEPWFANGGSDTTLNALTFGEDEVTITQLVFDGNGRHVNAENAVPYTLDESGLTITLLDGSALELTCAASGNRLVLGDGEYLSATQVDEGLQGYWVYYERGSLPPLISYSEAEYHVRFEDGMMAYEHANTSALDDNEFFYWGPYEDEYTLGLGAFETDIREGDVFSFNIIDGSPVLLRYSDVFTPTDEGFPGPNGYPF